MQLYFKKAIIFLKSKGKAVKILEQISSLLKRNTKKSWLLIWRLMYLNMITGAITEAYLWWQEPAEAKTDPQSKLELREAPRLFIT